MAEPTRPMKRASIPQHTGSGMEPCSADCKGCRAEQEQIDRMVIPPPMDAEALRAHRNRRDRRNIIKWDE